MKKMIKMMVAVAVFAMAVLVTPESTGAGVPEEKLVHNTYSDCETSSGLGDVVFREERILIDEIEFIESCIDIYSWRINADCTVDITVDTTCTL